MMKIFELHWTSQDEVEWVAANTIIQALKTYCSITSVDLVEFDDEDIIREVPKSKWSKMIVRNTDYDATDPDDWESMTFSKWMKLHKQPDIIAGTMYD